MKRLILLAFIIACASKAQAQTQIQSFANDPATCDPTRGLVYFNTTSSIYKYCSSLNTWSTLAPGTLPPTAVQTTGSPTANMLPAFTGTNTIGPTSPCALLQPTANPLSNQFLQANPPSGGNCQTSWGFPAANGHNTFRAVDNGVGAGGFKFCDANVASATNVVTVGNDANQHDPDLTTLGITTSWIAWVSTWNCSGFNTTYAILNAVGTVVSVDSATQLHISTSSSGACNGTAGGQTNKCTLYLFPQDDTTAINNWVAAVGAPGICGVGLMWSGYAYWSGTGPLNFPAGCSATNTGNGSKTGGVSIVGDATNNSVLVVGPNFNVTNCPGANAGCIFYVPSNTAQNNVHFQDFGIDGGGQGVPTGNGANKSAMSFGPSSDGNNISITAWGIGNGIQAQGSNNAPVQLSKITISGTSQGGGFSLIANQDVDISQCNIFWSKGQLAQFNGGPIFGAATTRGCQFGEGGQGSGGTGGMVNVPSGGLWISKQDYFNNPYSNTEDEVQVDGTAAIDSGVFSAPAATGDIGIHVPSGGQVTISGLTTLAMSSNSGVGLKVESGGTAITSGPINNTSVTPYSIAGSLLGSAAIPSTLITAAKLVLSAGWGSTAAWTALSGANAPIQGTITNSGTGQGASPTIAYTFPTAYAISPLSCTATQTGGTNATGTFTTSALSATGVTFTFSLTPTAAATEIVQITCVLP